jgi:hypothetical protein
MPERRKRPAFYRQSISEGCGPTLIGEDTIRGDIFKTDLIVAEVAANTPPKQNPHPEGTANWRDWNRRHHQDFTGLYLDDGRG